MRERESPVLRLELEGFLLVGLGSNAATSSESESIPRELVVALIKSGRLDRTGSLDVVSLVTGLGT